MSGLRRNGHGIVEEELLSPIEAADEAMVMGLRLAEGVEAPPLAVSQEAIDRMVSSGHLERDGSRIRATAKGRLVLNSLLAEIAA